MLPFSVSAAAIFSARLWSCTQVAVLTAAPWKNKRQASRPRKEREGEGGGCWGEEETASSSASHLGVKQNKEDVVRVRLCPPVKSLGQVLVLRGKHNIFHLKVKKKNTD